MRSFIRVNHKIRATRIRCIDQNGEMLGIVAVRDAMKQAQDAGLDLVEIAPNADPPVCRIMDFGKYRYEESVKRKDARKNQHQRVIKEVKFHANTGEHDFETKLNHMREFLSKGHKVKLSLMFRGRENAHRELGFELINRALKACEDIGVVESPPRAMGRFIYAILNVKPAVRN